MTEITDEIIQAARRADEDGLALYSDREIGVILAAIAPLIEAQARAEIEAAPAIGWTNEFEKYPALTCHILRMASTGQTGSGIEWDGFLRELNIALSALRADLAQARAAAIEEAAKVADVQQHDDYRDDELTEWGLTRRNRGREIAAAIRALSRPVSEREGEKA